MLSQSINEKVRNKNIPKSKVERQYEKKSRSARDNGPEANRPPKYHKNA